MDLLGCKAPRSSMLSNKLKGDCWPQATLKLDRLCSSVLPFKAEGSFQTSTTLERSRPCSSVAKAVGKNKNGRGFAQNKEKPFQFSFRFVSFSRFFYTPRNSSIFHPLPSRFSPNSSYPLIIIILSFKYLSLSS